MLNTQQYNNLQFNNNLLYGDIVLDAISFEGFGLQNETYSIHTTNWDSIADIDINSFSNPQDNGGFILSRYYKDKTISMSGNITASSENDLITAIDNLKGKLSKVEGYLYVKFGDSFRKIKATVKDINIQRNHYNIDFIGFTIEFLCKEPFFSALNVGTESYLNNTGLLQDDINYIGTGETYPSIYIIFGIAVSTTGIDVTIGDKIITINSVITLDSVVHIDGDRKVVTINGIEVDYSGVIGKLVQGSNIIKVDVTGTNYIHDTSIIYDIRYK